MLRRDHAMGWIPWISFFLGIIVFMPAIGGAADFPTKPIQLIIPFSPGGTVDIMGRLVSDKSAEYLGQPMVLIHKTGAGATMGINFVAKARPDGYTLGLGANSPLAVRKAIDPNLPYDPIKDLTAIALLSIGSNVVLVKADSPLNTLEKLVDYAKKNPGKVNYGTSGVGTTLHLSGELLQLAAGIQMSHVPHKGSAPCMVALLGGHIDLAFNNYVDAVEHIKAGKVIPLVVTSTQRFNELPQVPTVVEKGYPDAVMTFFLGVVGPAGLPKPITEKLSRYFQKTLDLPDVNKKIKEFGMDKAYMGPNEFGKFLQDEVAKMQNLAKKANLKVE